MSIPLTLLTITPVASGPRLTPYSARGLHQTLDQILQSNAAQQIRRDINGGLMDLTYAQFQKYQSTITCTDSTTPALDGAWLGQLCVVQCTKELSYLTVGGTPQRPEVSGSSHEEGEFTYYRPVLTMRVMAIHDSFDEWRSTYQWQIDLQEV